MFAFSEHTSKASEAQSQFEKQRESVRDTIKSSTKNPFKQSEASSNNRESELFDKVEELPEFEAEEEEDNMFDQLLEKQEEVKIPATTPMALRKESLVGASISEVLKGARSAKSAVGNSSMVGGKSFKNIIKKQLLRGTNLRMSKMASLGGDDTKKTMLAKISERMNFDHLALRD